MRNSLLDGCAWCGVCSDTGPLFTVLAWSSKTNSGTASSSVPLHFPPPPPPPADVPSCPLECKERARRLGSLFDVQSKLSEGYQTRTSTHNILFVLFLLSTSQSRMQNERRRNYHRAKKCRRGGGDRKRTSLFWFHCSFSLTVREDLSIMYFRVNQCTDST